MDEAWVNLGVGGSRPSTWPRLGLAAYSTQHLFYTISSLGLHYIYTFSVLSLGLMRNVPRAPSQSYADVIFYMLTWSCLCSLNIARISTASLAISSLAMSIAFCVHAQT